MAGQSGNANTTSWKLMSGTLNGENNAGLGSQYAYNGIPGSIVPQYAGFIGTKYTLSADDAGKYSDSTIGTLYGGTYQYIRVAAAATQGQLTRGRLVFWDTSAAEDVYQVTNDESQNGGQPLFAGVLLNAPTAGNYAIIQVKGRATVKMRATVTAATRDFVWAGAGAGVDNATFDGLAGATGLTGANIQKQLATGEAVAANGGLIIAYLNPTAFVERN